jgi:hypothetical protein
MIILGTFGVMLALAAGLAAAAAWRDRRSGPVSQNKIDADSAHSLIIPPGGHSVSEYLPPPDDGRPSH